MRRKLATLSVAALLLAPAASYAQVELGARLGYAFGIGDVGSGFADGAVHMSDYTRSHIPLQLDVLFRVTPQLSIGPYFSYGFAQMGGTFDDFCGAPGMDCDARILRLGMEATYRLARQGPFVPWFGAGIGYEWSRLHAEGGGDSGDIHLSGFELLNLQVGGDFHTAPRFRFGPFAQLSFAQYSSAEATGGFTDPNDIPSKTVHQWFQVGVRGSFDL